MLSDLWGWMTAQVERIDNPKALILICLVSYPLCALMLLLARVGIYSLAWAFLGPLLVYLAHLLASYVRRTPKDRVGVLICLHGDQDEDSQRAVSQFTAEMQSAAHQASERFYVNVVQQSVAKRVVDLDEAKKLLRKSRGHFLVYGQVSKGKLQGQSGYLLRNYQLVVHSRVSDQLRSALSGEMSQVFPTRLFVGAEDDLQGYLYTGALFGLAARYTIGVAALYSRDFSYSENLLRQVTELNPTISRNSPAAKVFSVVVKRAKSRLAQICMYRARLAYFEWNRIRSRSQLEVVRTEIENAAGWKSPTNTEYEYYTLKAICAFGLDRNISVARQNLYKCRNSGDASWRFSEAFLRAYEGNVSGACECYRRTLNKPVPPEMVQQVVSFLEWVLIEEPQKKQIYFCLGYVLHHWSNCSERARDYYEKALTYLEAGDNDEAICERIQAWLDQLESERD